MAWVLFPLKNKVDSSAVIKPFDARFANSKKCIYAYIVYICFSPRTRPHTSDTLIALDGGTPQMENSFECQQRRRKTWNMTCDPTPPCTSQNFSHTPTLPLDFSTVPGGCRIRRKITRAYLGLSQAHAINAQCAVTVKNEVAVQRAEQGELAKVGQGRK